MAEPPLTDHGGDLFSGALEPLQECSWNLQLSASPEGTGWSTHYLYKSINRNQAFLHFKSTHEEFHKGKNRSQYLLCQKLKLFFVLCFNSKYMYTVNTEISCLGALKRKVRKSELKGGMGEILKKEKEK